MKYIKHVILLVALFFIQGCDENSPEKSTIDILIDLDPKPNQILETTIKNGVSVGLTVYADSLKEVNYQLLDSAEERFRIDESTGVVSVADYLLLNYRLFSSHSITVQALYSDGSTQSKVFDISVIPTIDTFRDIDPTPNQIIETANKNGLKVGLTVYTESLNDVSYQLLDSAGGRFIIDAVTGVVSLGDYLLLNAQLFPSHSITVRAQYADGSFQEKIFEISVISGSHSLNVNLDLDSKLKLNYVREGIKNQKLSLEKDIDKPKQKASTKANNNDIENVTQYNLLFDWNNGHGQIFNGWRWNNNVAYKNPGWVLSEEGPLGGGEKYAWGWGVRSFNKGDYGKKNTALIDTTDYAPSTNGGGSLKITETDDSKDHRSTWWLWYDGKPLSERGITNKKTDRMDFYLKAEGMNGQKADGRKESLVNNFHIGTYLCWKTVKTAYGRGDGCPYEGPGNQHYYHYLGINPGAWIHVVLDQHPQHKRGSKHTINNNPTWDKNKKNYFEQLSQFYIEIRARQKQKTNFKIDEVLFYSTEDSVEPQQNEQSISSLWVGYWAEKDVWEMGFHDKSQRKYNDEHNSTFEIRWSISPITNKNFHNANLIDPMFYGGVKAAGLGGENLIRRANGWQSNVWTRFKLPDNVEDEHFKIFFAVKDVSVLGNHIGTKWPYNKGDGHNAPTSNIKIIDYYLRLPAK